VLSLARQQDPDTSAYTDAEIVFRVRKPYHVGFVVASERPERVEALLDQYAARFRNEFFASAPLPDKPTS
jgi:hypothetical protein